ncbi:ArnT family glycosyltransferase [Nitritalea halalkaliphila]|uniref:ArnT family glycosyltransferase n=1 Tax=Nitritalea halalkaliphila TaxID=590849 RepID=UPI0002FA8CEC|nr:glycosyltransferase family 39 protein [Nitritalea halalkaliphila]
MDQKSSPYFRLLLLAIIGSALLKIAFFAFSGLSIFTEEAQYWLWSKHLDWNYYSKPLLIAVYNAISSALFGDTWWAIKANALFFHAATLIVFYRLTLRFLNPKQALIASLLLLCSPFLHIASLFHTTDSSLYFFWTLGLYLSVKTIEQPALKHWIALGICLLLGILSKNIMVLLLPTWALFMTLQSPSTWKKAGPYLMLGISLLSLIPVLYWNLQNDFVTFRHVGTLGGVAGTSTGPSLPARLGEYIGGQLGFFSPFYLPLLCSC